MRFRYITMAYAATPDIYKAIQKLAIAIEQVTK